MCAIDEYGVHIAQRYTPELDGGQLILMSNIRTTCEVTLVKPSLEAKFMDCVCSASNFTTSADTARFCTLYCSKFCSHTFRTKSIATQISVHKLPYISNLHALNMWL